MCLVSRQSAVLPLSFCNGSMAMCTKWHNHVYHKMNSHTLLNLNAMNMDIYTVHQNSQSPVNMLVWGLLKLAPTIPSSKDCIKHAKMIQHTLVKHFSIASSFLQIVDVSDVKLLIFAILQTKTTHE